MLIVGLGNPGPQYAMNRHNVGFLLLEAICRAFSFSMPKIKYQGSLSEGVIEEKKVYAFFPLTYMNLCGSAVGEVVRFYKIPLDHVFVLHDELDLPFAKIRVKRGGGAGGHNGLRSLDRSIGSEYWRLRFGIDHPGHKDLVASYVLSNFSKAEQQILPTAFSHIATELPVLLAGAPDKFQNNIALHR